VVFSCLVAWVA